MNKVYMPDTLNNLWDIMDKSPEALLYSGGTDLLVKIRSGHVSYDRLICLENIKEIKGVKFYGDSVWIGSAATVREIMASDIIQKEFPLLWKSLNSLGSPLIRNMATLGGNICTASPAGDSLPALYMLEGEVILETVSSKRNLPVADFITGPGKTLLKNGEILTGILIKKQRGFNINHFEKVGQRKSLAIAIASFGAMMRLSRKGIIEEGRMAWGSVGPTVIRSKTLEESLTGKSLTLETLKEASLIAGNLVKPIDDIRAGAEYRRIVSGNLMLRLFIYR